MNGSAVPAEQGSGANRSPVCEMLGPLLDESGRWTMGSVRREERVELLTAVRGEVPEALRKIIDDAVAYWNWIAETRRVQDEARSSGRPLGEVSLPPEPPGGSFAEYELAEWVSGLCSSGEGGTFLACSDGVR